MAKKKTNDESWGTWDYESCRQMHGAMMLHIGFKVFLVGSIFWIGGILSWPWYESVTFIGLVLFIVGWIKKMGGMHQNY